MGNGTLGKVKVWIVCGAVAAAAAFVWVWNLLNC